MRRIAVFVFSSGLAFATCTVTPSTLTFSQGQLSVHDFAQSVTVSSDCGAWTTAGLSDWRVYPSSGGAPATVYIRPYSIPFTQAVGQTSGTITFSGAGGSGTVTVVLNTRASQALPPVSNPARATEASLSCSYGGNVYTYWHANVCPFSNAIAWGMTNISFTPGTSYTDPLWGSKVTTVAPRVMPYAKRSYISPYDATLGTYLVLSSGAGGSDPLPSGGIYGSDGRGVIWPHPYDGSALSAKFREMQFSSLDSRKLYALQPDGWYTMTLGTPPAYTLNSTPIWSEQTGRQMVQDPYQQITKDDWSANITSDKQRLYVINLANPSQWASYNLTTISPSIDVTSTSTTDKADVLSVQLTNKDSVTGLRYVRFLMVNQSYMASRYFSYDEKTNTIAYLPDALGPTQPETPINGTAGANWARGASASQCAIQDACVSGGHTSFIETSSGVQHWLIAQGRQIVYSSFAAGLRASSRDYGTTGIEAGGGAFPAGVTGDYMMPALFRPYVFSVYQQLNTGAQAQYMVSSCTAANPAVCTLLSEYGGTISSVDFTSGSAVVVAWGTGNTAINAVSTATTVSGATVTLPFDNTGNTYTANSAWIAKKADWAGESTNNFVAATRYSSDGRMIQIRKLARTMCLSYGGYCIGGWAGAFTNVSPDGKLVCFSTNAYRPGRNYVTLCLPSDLDATKDDEFAAGKAVKVLAIKRVTATLSLDAPDSQSITCTWSTSRDLTGGGSATLSGPGTRRTAAMSGLTPATQYWGRCVSADSYYAAVFNFETAP
jgi:hypothetical protein